MQIGRYVHCCPTWDLISLQMLRDIGSVEYDLQLLGTWREQEPIKVDTFD